VGGNVAQFSAAEWESTFSGPAVGQCVATYPLNPDLYLNAGPSFTFSGPGVAAGTVVPIIALPNGPDYQYNPPSNSMVPGGTYTMTGPGGTQVDAFAATVTVPSSFTVTNWSSLTLVNRAQPLTVNGNLHSSHGSARVSACHQLWPNSVQAGLVTDSFIGTSLTPGLVAGGQGDFGALAPFLGTIQVNTIR
jgi:hypothetical protein